MIAVLAMQQTAQYKRHRPENTLLYPLVERHYPEFKETLSEQGKQFPKFVEREFDEFLRCGRLEQESLRVVCGDCKQAKTGAVTIIQHFGSALNLNIHFHMHF
jgi:hypothetical protein